MSFPWRRSRSFTPVGALEGKASFRLLRPKKGQQKISSKKCSQKSQKGQQQFSSVFPKRSTKSPSVPVSRLKSKIFTSNLVKKKVCPPQPKSPGDAYANPSYFFCIPHVYL